MSTPDAQVVQLRDGTESYDTRLDRSVHFDERSRAYNVAELNTKPPRSYSWGCYDVLDQGREGACVGFSVAHELMARPKVVKGLDNAYAYDLYHRAQHLDPWAGCSKGANCEIAPNYAQRYHGTSVLAGVKEAQKRGFFKEYRWAFTTSDLATAVSRTGPAILGINWHAGMYKTRPVADGRHAVDVSGRIVGGHAILCAGYNVKRREFLLFNSWGPTWGNKGRAWISHDALDALLQARGEACIPVVR